MVQHKLLLGCDPANTTSSSACPSTMPTGRGVCDVRANSTHGGRAIFKNEVKAIRQLRPTCGDAAAAPLLCHTYTVEANPPRKFFCLCLHHNHAAGSRKLPHCTCARASRRQVLRLCAAALCRPKTRCAANHASVVIITPLMKWHRRACHFPLPAMEFYFMTNETLRSV